MMMLLLRLLELDLILEDAFDLNVPFLPVVVKEVETETYFLQVVLPSSPFHYKIKIPIMRVLMNCHFLLQ